MRRISLALLLSAIAATSAASLPILNDDYAKARTEAIRRRVPLFIDVWAQW